jgi:hypothetical protein
MGPQIPAMTARAVEITFQIDKKEQLPRKFKVTTSPKARNSVKLKIAAQPDRLGAA